MIDKLKSKSFNKFLGDLKEFLELEKHRLNEMSSNLEYDKQNERIDYLGSLGFIVCLTPNSKEVKYISYSPLLT